MRTIAVETMMSTIVRIRNVLFISVFPVYYSYESQAANTIAVNESAERDAPPTNAPSISSQANKPAAFSGFTEPPY
jgi:hypothetical protein